MSTTPMIFDRQLLKARRNRAANSFEKSDFLIRTCAERLTDRLLDLTKRFKTVLNLGCYTGELAKVWPAQLQIPCIIHADLSPKMAEKASIKGLAVNCDEEILPFSEGSLDAIISCLCLHWVNDLPGSLLQIRRSLKPDGMLLASLLGTETLFELRDALALAELEIMGGVSPRISPFIHISDLGSLLQRAGFALPVVDTEIITVTYEDFFHLTLDLRRMGATNALNERSKIPTPRKVFMRAAEIYLEKFGDKKGRIPATFQILTITGWTPDPSQQKPLKPGTAKRRLSEVFGVSEELAGEKTRPS